MKVEFLVHAHVYYAEMWPELSRSLQVIPAWSRELWVTLPLQQTAIAQRIRTDFPDARILYIRNVGYDIYPFTEVLRRVELAHYRFCIKVHTKRNLLTQTHVGAEDVSGSLWREYLLSFLAPEHFCKCLTAFDRNEKLGMVGHHSLICHEEPADAVAWQQSLHWLTQCGMLSGEIPDDLSFVAGSMFMCRAHLLQPVKTILQNREFEVPSHENPSTLSHCAERLLGHVVGAAGYSIQDVYTKRKSRFYLALRSRCIYGLRRMLRLIYQKKITRSRHLLIKFCKIPVCHLSLKD